jgi:hypothetical protein
MKKDQVGYDMQKFEWVVVKDKTVKIVIDQAESLKDYDFLKEYSPCILYKTLRSPLMIHDAIV